MKAFDETSRLSSEELHRVLAAGDAPDRVFAIWALALRSHAGRLMVDQLRVEPDPGVRRSLAVVLAGDGELDLLVAMCRWDPSVHVRASVVQMVMRFAAAERMPWSIVLERLSDSAEVRASVVGQVNAQSPEQLRSVAVDLLRDEDEMVRREAFETCLRLVHAGALAFDARKDVLERASSGERANALRAWFAVSQPELIGQVLASASRDVRECALRMRPTLARTALAPLLADDAELFVRLRHALRLHLDEATLATLLGVALLDPLDFVTVGYVTRRLSEVERLPSEQLGLLHSLVGRCEATIATNADTADGPGELAVYDADDDLQDDLAFRRHVHGQLLEQVVRLDR